MGDLVEVRDVRAKSSVDSTTKQITIGRVFLGTQVYTPGQVRILWNSNNVLQLNGLFLMTIEIDNGLHFCHC